MNIWTYLLDQMSKFWPFLLIILCAPSAPYYKHVEVLSVYDGDTFTVNLPCEEALFCHKIPVRIKGIDAPEIRARCTQERLLATKARDYLKALLEAKEVTLRDCERDKYFRIACHVYADRLSVSSALLSADLARPYHKNSKKDNWCAAH